jgi:hypothetical protein
VIWSICISRQIFRHFCDLLESMKKRNLTIFKSRPAHWNEFDWNTARNESLRTRNLVSIICDIKRQKDVRIANARENQIMSWISMHCAHSNLQSHAPLPQSRSTVASILSVWNGINPFGCNSINSKVWLHHQNWNAPLLSLQIARETVGSENIC